MSIVLVFVRSVTWNFSFYFVFVFWITIILVLVLWKRRPVILLLVLIFVTKITLPCTTTDRQWQRGSGVERSGAVYLASRLAVHTSSSTRYTMSSSVRQISDQHVLCLCWPVCKDARSYREGPWHAHQQRPPESGLDPQRDDRTAAGFTEALWDGLQEGLLTILNHSTTELQQASLKLFEMAYKKVCEPSQTIPRLEQWTVCKQVKSKQRLIRVTKPRNIKMNGLYSNIIIRGIKQ